MGVVGGQCVLNNDRFQVRMFPAKIAQQSLCCIAFAVVFVSAVFFSDKLGGERKNLAVIGVDHRRYEHLVEVFRRPVTVILDATILTLDLVRRTTACAIDSDQVMILENGPVLKNLSTLQEGKNCLEAGPQAARSTPSKRSRNRESEGIRFTPNIDLRLLASVELLFKRPNSSSFSSDGIFKLNTASPTIRQSDRVIPRGVIGSGTRSKHLRIARSIPGIDRSLRNEVLDISYQRAHELTFIQGCQIDQHLINSITCR